VTELHVVTVHWHDARWIEPQRRYLERFAPGARLWAAVNGIDLALARHCHLAEDLEGSHPEKLNELAARVVAAADPDDLLLFLDGDAFPVGPVDASLLDGHPLAAMRRDENVGQRQPHPAFALTTAGWWAEVGGDWRRGHTWIASNGEEISDTGGNLLGILEARGIAWRPLLRSNRYDLDPLWFGVYADVVYHHGAGFRPPISMMAMLPAQKARQDAVAAAVIPESVPVLGRLERSLRFRLARRRGAHAVQEYAAQSQDLSDEVFGWIEREPEFYRRFTDPDGYVPPEGSGSAAGPA
jgi:hypothetical protein